MLKNIFGNVFKSITKNNGVHYLFVSGCGRSGTSLVTRILAAHPSIVLGSERYMRLYSRSFNTFRPDLFGRERFFSLRETDGGHFSGEISDATRKHYESMAIKWDNKKYVGDKIPTIFYKYKAIRKIFSNVKFVHVTRNIYDVMSSWSARAKLGTLPSELDYKKTVEVWNDALTMSIAYHSKCLSEICLINYENIFSDGNIGRLFHVLDSSLDPSCIDGYVGNLKVRAELLSAARKDRELNDEQRKYIDRHARLDLYDKYKEIAIF